MTPTIKQAAAFLSVPGLVAESTSALSAHPSAGPTTEPSAHPSAGPTTVGPTSWHVHGWCLCCGICGVYDADWTGEWEWCEVGNCTKPWNNPNHCEQTDPHLYDNGRICCQCEAHPSASPSSHPSAGPTTEPPTTWHVDDYLPPCVGICSLYDARYTGEWEWCEVGNCTKPWNNPNHCEQMDPHLYDNGRICCQCEAHPSASPSSKPTYTPAAPSAHPSAGPTTVGPTNEYIYESWPHPPCLIICILSDSDWSGESERCDLGACIKPWNNPNHCEQVNPGYEDPFRLCCQCEAHPSASPSSKPTATAPSPPDCVPDLVESGNCTRPLTFEECSDAANRLGHNWDANPIDPDKPLDHIPGGCFAKRKNRNGGNGRIVKFRYNPHTEPGTNCGQDTKGGAVTKLCVCCA